MTYLFRALAASILLSAVALADDKESSAEATFKSLDVNADGRLSPAEVTPDKEMSSQFVALDANADGFLTLREYKSANAKPGERASDR
jgi:Ca2+-binding EF-hand superfamily protein